jgi:hypothetical protein
MKPIPLNSDVDARRGIERWENEGGRIRFGTEMSSRSNRPNDAGLWERASAKNDGEAGPGSFSDGVKRTSA